MKNINSDAEIQSLKRKGLTDEKMINELVSFKINNPKLFNKKLPTELPDKVNLMCRKYMDRMARFEVDYDFVIDEEKFKNVAVCALESAPFLHSKVINNPVAPYWKVCDYHVDQFVEYKTVSDLDKAKKDFFSREIPLNSNIQFNIGIFIHENKSYVTFIWNHMCMDGGGFKSFWADFSKAYSQYVSDGKPPLCFKTGSRKYTEVYAQMPEDKAKRAKQQFSNISPKVKRIFPFKNNNIEKDVVIVSRMIDGEHFKKALEFAKSRNATVTDLLIAVYIHSLGKLTDLKSTDDITVSCAMDLRRYIPDLSNIGYTNHVSFAHCYIKEKGGNISETLDAVKIKMKEIKSDEFMGLHGLPLLNLGYKTMVYLQAETIVKLFYNNPVLSVSNVGAIDTAAFSLAGNPPFSAFVAGAAKNKPCAVMTALSINNKLSVSMCLRGNDEDREVLEKFFTEFKNTIDSL